MKIVEQKAECMSCTVNPLDIIEHAARICYASTMSATPKEQKRFLNSLLTRQHLTPFEHAIATVRIRTNRAIANELTRHRLISVNQLSTRYTNNEKLSVILPLGLGKEGEELFKKAMQKAEEYHSYILDHCSKFEVARDVLPLATATELIVTANFREWMHILALRSSDAAHPLMRALMELVKPELVRKTGFAFEKEEIDEHKEN
jgi:thymidylate synthase (FAD)